MQHTFRYNKTDRYLIFGLSLATVIILLVAWVLDPLEFKTWVDVAIGAILFLIFASLSLLAWATHIWHLTVDDSGLSIVNWRRTRRFLWTEIKGYRMIMDKVVSIEFVAPRWRPYSISYPLDNQPTFIQILRQRLPDLNVEDSQVERTAIFTNEQFGATEEERLDFLQKARKRANSWSLVAALAGILPLFLPHPSTIELLIPLVFPFVLMAVSLLSKGSIRILSNGVNSVLPNIAIGLFLGTMLYSISAIIKNEVLDLHLLLGPMFIAGIVYGGIFYLCLRIGNQQFSSKKGIGVIIFMLSIFYSFGAAIWTNRMFDKGLSTCHNAVILSKRSTIHAFVFHEYYINVRDWLPSGEPLEIELNSEQYKACKPGDSLFLRVKPGFWGARWVEKLVMSEER